MSGPKVKDPGEAPEGWEGYVSAFVEGQCKCVYCGFRGTRYSTWRQLVVDHFIPAAAGGEDSARNYVVCCYRCNNFKGSYDPGGRRYTHLPAEKKERTALIKKTRVEIRKRERKQRRHDFYLAIERKIKLAT